MGRGESGTVAGAGQDSQVREQESREISAMQQRLNKNSTRVSAINEGSLHGHEKGAIKKQPQVCVREGGGRIVIRIYVFKKCRDITRGRGGHCR